MSKRYINLVLLCATLTFGCKTISKEDLEIIDFTSYLNINFGKNAPNLVDVFPIKIIKFGEAKIYIIYTRNFRVGTEINNKGERKIDTDTTFSYLYVEKDKKTGLKLDSLGANFFQKFNVDSLMDRINISNEHLEDNSKTNGKLDHIRYDKKNNKVLLEKYFISNGKFDSSYRYYDYSMKDVDFSIAPKLDQKYGTKLVKFVDIKNTKQDDKGIINNREEVSLEIKIGTYKNPSEIIKLFERFKQEAKKKY